MAAAIRAARIRIEAPDAQQADCAAEVVKDVMRFVVTPRPASAAPGGGEGGDGQGGGEGGGGAGCGHGGDPPPGPLQTVVDFVIELGEDIIDFFD
jgi:hypothetical protein